MRIRRSRPNSSVESITAVIPCYNYGHFLPMAVESVLSQVGVDPKVIIVDDASTDNSLEVAHHLARQDSRITVVAHAQNMGHIATYNDGLGRVDTDYVLLLSADDFLAPGGLANATRLMDAEPSVGMVYGRPSEFSEGEAIDKRVGKNTSWTIWKGREWLSLACLRGRCFILSPEVVMRTAAMREVGGYNDNLPHSGDLEYWIRTAARWDIGRINGSVQAYYRTHGSNMHITAYAGIARDLRERLAAFNVLLAESLKSDISNAEQQYGRAARGVAREARVLALRNLDVGGAPLFSRELIAIASESSPETANGVLARYLAHRYLKAIAGQQPVVIHRVAEKIRQQLDRVRWVFWRKVGIS